MRRFRPFMQKEQKGLEGRTIDIGNMKVNVRNVMAEGGFSCVYLVCDAVHPSQQYALKHIICNDEESLDLVKKEISVMNLLEGHPNVVSLVAHTVMDMGRAKEAFLVMECCEKTLVNVLESRGAGYFEEKQILLIFRDVCNAVFAMHCLSPPIAHRDLKAENLLLGPDEMWKLCDFGSTSTNHKRFERPEEMGIEEDNIRKHTTPAYRAPEMWDLFRRELINEKVDIWALGCLLYRICYFKSAFDGDSKLQVLNGNYRIPELPKYTSVTDLIKDMLQASPDARPDITQVWFRVNGLLPESLQKSLPDRPADGGISNPARKSAAMPRRSPPPPPSKAPVRSAPELHVASEAIGGAFWSSHHANDLFATEEVEPVHDEPRRRSLSKYDKKGSPDNSRHPGHGVPQSEQTDRAHPRRSSQAISLKKFANGPSEDFKPRFPQEDMNRGSEKTGVSQPEKTVTSQNEAFNTFVADFDTAKLDSLYINNKSEKEQYLEDEVARLKEQLKQINSEKDEVASKYEKLSAICRSQGQEIQELKQTLAMKSPSPNRDVLHEQNISTVSQSGTTQQHETIQRTMSELQKGVFNNSSPSPNSDQRKAFSDELRSRPKSVRTTNFHQSKNASAASPATDSWGFGTDNFTAVPTASPIEKAPGQGDNSQHRSDSKSMERKKASQPAGWAGF